MTCIFPLYLTVRRRFTNTRTFDVLALRVGGGVCVCLVIHNVSERCGGEREREREIERERERERALSLFLIFLYYVGIYTDSSVYFCVL